MNRARIREAVADLARQYPPSLVDEQVADIDRIADHIALVADRVGTSVELLDLCGGIGLFSVGCAAVGMRVTLVDDFGDSNNRPIARETLRIHEKLRVRVLAGDVATSQFDVAPASIDVLTCFDALEHWHHNPRRILHTAFSWLRPGGLLVLQTPNCVNLRKRITVPLGKGKWSPFDHWYREDTFRGHVREPDVSDLRRIGADLGLEQIEILGRNWLGLIGRSGLVLAMTRLIDQPLRLRPSLCSNIYLVGRKPR